jgi:hypothetical protein
MDLVGLYQKPSARPVWTTVTMPGRGWLWFALKDVAALPQTVLWMSNGGRHAAPWNGVNRCLGVEDGCACYTLGLAASRKKNELSSAGIPTTVSLRPDRPFVVNHIQGMARIPKGFDTVKSAAFLADGVVFTSPSGKTVKCPVQWGFLRSGRIAVAG